MYLLIFFVCCRRRSFFGVLVKFNRLLINEFFYISLKDKENVYII